MRAKSLIRHIVYCVQISNFLIPTLNYIKIYQIVCQLSTSASVQLTVHLDNFFFICNSTPEKQAENYITFRVNEVNYFSYSCHSNLTLLDSLISRVKWIQ